MDGVKSGLCASFFLDQPSFSLKNITRDITSVHKFLCTYFFSLFLKIRVFKKIIKKSFIYLSFIVDFTFLKKLFKQESLYGI